MSNSLVPARPVELETPGGRGIDAEGIRTRESTSHHALMNRILFEINLDQIKPTACSEPKPNHWLLPLIAQEHLRAERTECLVAQVYTTAHFAIVEVEGALQ